MPRAIFAAALALSIFASPGLTATTPVPPAAPVAPKAPAAPTAPAKPAVTPAKPAAAQPAKPATPAAPHEELWFFAKASDGAVGYDAKSIKRNTELSTVSLISLVYLKSGAKTKSGVSYSYVLSEDSFDCIGQQVKPISRLVFDSTGKLLDAGDAPPNWGWGIIPQNSPLGAFRSVACTAATFGKMQQAPNLTATMKAMREMK